MKPVSPSVATAPPPDTDVVVERINAVLSTTWNNYERDYGRHIGAKSLGQDPEHIAGLFTREGWIVMHTSDQRDGDFWTFRPTPRDAR